MNSSVTLCNETRRPTDKPSPILKTSKYQLSKKKNEKGVASVDPEQLKVELVRKLLHHPLVY